MPDDAHPRHGVHRYRSVTEGVAMANEYLSSRLSMSEFARQKGISFRMVKYWSARARQLAAEASAPAPPAGSGSLVAIGTIDDRHGVIVARPHAQAEAAPAPSPPSPIEVHLPGGARVSVGPGFSPEILRSVVACLAHPC